MWNRLNKVKIFNDFPLDNDDGRRRRLTGMLLIAGSMVAAGLMAQDIAAGNFVETGIDLFILFSFALCFIWLPRVRRAEWIYRLAVGSLATGLLFIAFTDEDQTKFLLLLLFPQLFHFILGNREGLVWNISTLVLIMVRLTAFALSGEAYPLAFILRFFIAYACISLVAYTQEWIRALYFKKLIDEKEELNRANREIRKLSCIDNLTGVFNRGYLDRQLEKEFKYSRRSEKSLAVVLCDIDHFKRINDQYGHPVGDQVLKIISNVFSEGVRRDIDWVSRYGGEEFLLVLPGTDTPGAKKVSERIRLRISRGNYEVDGISIRTSVSFGISVLDDPLASTISNPEVLLKMADDALYHAKQTGRNKVICHSDLEGRTG
ncbi:GGDEF domain-containing protein [Desulfospira joergensenii]|uniref:GGDEF domain-containing protein n=1 Tax=Desulfospira joergensenii TaxID=53329 RepID=UPI0003B75EBF|nr:GGDEF domain-containing protein [Desulfospira joergensenii]